MSETTTGTTTLTTTTLSNAAASAAAAAATTLTRRHSISTTTPVTEVKSLVTAAPTNTGIDNNNLPGQLVKTELESRRKVECVDAESNTVNSGKAFNFSFVGPLASVLQFIMIRDQHGSRPYHEHEIRPKNVEHDHQELNEKVTGSI